MQALFSLANESKRALLGHYRKWEPDTMYEYCAGDAGPLCKGALGGTWLVVMIVFLFSFIGVQSTCTQYKQHLMEPIFTLQYYLD